MAGLRRHESHGVSQFKRSLVNGTVRPQDALLTSTGHATPALVDLDPDLRSEPFRSDPVAVITSNLRQPTSLYLVLGLEFEDGEADPSAQHWGLPDKPPRRKRPPLLVDIYPPANFPLMGRIYLKIARSDLCIMSFRLLSSARGSSRSPSSFGLEMPLTQ